MKGAMERWTRRLRMAMAFAIAWPLSIAMIIAGALSVSECDNKDVTNIESIAPLLASTQASVTIPNINLLHN